MQSPRTLDRIYPFTHSTIQCHFNPSARDFVVKEIPLYEPSGEGEHLILYVRKRGLSTFELLAKLSQMLGCKVRDIGYAGLKDKAASTYQYLSIHRSLKPALDSILPHLASEQIKILSITPHHNKLKIGHLKGNRFFMRLKKLKPTDVVRLESALKVLQTWGFPNYFGNQRFGNDGDNFQSGKAINAQQLKLKNKKMSAFLISSYQSYLFNQWLYARVYLSQIVHNFSANDVLDALNQSHIQALQTLKAHYSRPLIQSLQLQKQPFLLLLGDVMCHYPFGKTFICDDENIESTRFINREVSPTGALFGTKLMPAQKLALCIESSLQDSIRAIGSRRYAWVWAEDIEGKYIAPKAQYELCFSLPKGSYATIFLECLLNLPNAADSALS